jgi:hypothetical protein
VPVAVQVPSQRVAGASASRIALGKRAARLLDASSQHRITAGWAGGIDATVHAKIRELIVAGFDSNQLTGCVPHEHAIMELKDGTVSFIGSCPVKNPHATPAGGI